MTSQCKTSSDPHYASFPAPDIRWRARMRHLYTFWLADWKSSSYAFPQACDEGNTYLPHEDDSQTRHHTG